MGAPMFVVASRAHAREHFEHNLSRSEHNAVSGLITCLTVNNCLYLECCDAVGWAAGRVSGL